MFNYIFRRILISIPILIGITIINFLIIYMAPGSPIDLLTNPHVTQSALDAKKVALGLNDPIYIQYFKWFTNVIKGNLGYSMSTYAPVSQMIAQRIGPTFLLMGTSLIVGIIIAIPLGILSATKQYSKLDYFAVTGSFIGVSIPNFFLALGLVYVFSLKLQLLPSSGMRTIGQDGNFIDILSHLILPTIVLSANVAGRNVRYIRSSMLEILGQDYLRTARAKGLREHLVINKHALRNALNPLVTVFGFEIPMIFAGAIITEKVFSWPGLGQLTINSILSRDYPTIMALNLLVAISVVLANIFVDIMYVVVDPRIKYK